MRATNTDATARMVNNTYDEKLFRHSVIFDVAGSTPLSVRAKLSGFDASGTE